MKKSLFASLFVVGALCVPSLSQDKTAPADVKVAPIATYVATTGQRLIYKTILPPKIKGGQVSPGQEHVSIASIDSAGAITLHVKLYKETAGKLVLQDQGALAWEAVPSNILKVLFERNKDQLKKVTVTVGNHTFFCARVSLNPKQVAWIAVDKNMNNVFPGVLKMTFDDDPDDTIDPVTIMELIEVIPPPTDK